MLVMQDYFLNWSFTISLSDQKADTISSIQNEVKNINGIISGGTLIVSLWKNLINLHFSLSIKMKMYAKHGQVW